MNPFTSYSTPTGGQASVDAYTDVALVGQVPGGLDPIIQSITSGPLSFHLQNTGANSIAYTILGSNDKSFADAKWVTVAGSGAVIAASGVAPEYLDTGRFLFYKIQVKAAVGGAQGIIVAAVVAKRY